MPGVMLCHIQGVGFRHAVPHTRATYSAHSLRIKVHCATYSTCCIWRRRGCDIVIHGRDPVIHDCDLVIEVDLLFGVH